VNFKNLPLITLICAEIDEKSAIVCGICGKQKILSCHFSISQYNHFTISQFNLSFFSLIIFVL